jgi:hypothetical protein
VESHRATWARFSSRPRALQTKRRHRHGSFCLCKRARHAAARHSSFGARCRFIRRGTDFQAAQVLYRPSAGMTPLSVVSVQDTQPRRHSSFGGAVSLHKTRASFSSRLRALQTQRRQRHGTLAAVSVQGTLPYRPQVFGERVVASCNVGQLFKPPKGSSAKAPATVWRPSLQ